MSFKKLIVIACMFALMIPAFGCSEDGPAEKAGQKIASTVESVKDAAKDMIDNDGPAEKAGEKVDEAVEEAKEAVDKAAE
jgi:uncharacterized protein YjbJ (UPF0337 family)